MVGRDGSQPTGATRRPPAAAARVLDRSFGEDDLRDLRLAVAASLRALAVPADRAAELLVVANELSSNAVRHGGGSGRLRLWQDGPVLHCEVTDGGTGFADPDAVGRVRPPLTARGGRGLWLSRQLCDDLVVRSTPAGATVLASMVTTSGHRRGRRQSPQSSRTSDGNRTGTRVGSG